MITTPRIEPCPNTECHGGKVPKLKVINEQTVRIPVQCPVCRGMGEIDHLADARRDFINSTKPLFIAIGAFTLGVITLAGDVLTNQNNEIGFAGILGLSWFLFAIIYMAKFAAQFTEPDSKYKTWRQLRKTYTRKLKHNLESDPEQFQKDENLITLAESQPAQDYYSDQEG